jgi:cytoskeleton protein RodZ
MAPAGEVLARFLDPTALGTEGTPQVHEVVNDDARVILRAREVSWIQVSSASGDYLRDLTLGPEEVFLVPNRPDLSLWTGNAGGLEVIVDGAPVAPLGARGAVVRDVSLDPDRLRASATPGAADAPR